MAFSNQGENHVKNADKAQLVSHRKFRTGIARLLQPVEEAPDLHNMPYDLGEVAVRIAEELALETQTSSEEKNEKE